MNIDHFTFSALESFPRNFDQLFRTIPKEFLGWAPESWEGIPSESFTAVSHLCHIRDVEIDGYHVRFQKILEEDEPTLPQLDGYLLESERNYAKQDTATMFEQFQEARHKTLQLVASFSASQLNRTATFEGYGSVSLRTMVHYLCSHDYQHLSGLQWLRGKIYASKAGGVS